MSDHRGNSEGEYEEAESVPFYIGIETLKWTFENGDYITVERSTSGYLIGGRIGGKDWHDEDYEDFFCADTDAYLDFLEKHGLLRILSTRPDKEVPE